ncbi:hypothetical protein ACHAWF_004636, partial [Thalassiosira exigua]
SDEIRVHAWLLIWSWALLIPLGALVSKNTNRVQCQHPHFHLIYSCVLGFVLALAGFAYGINKFSTFSRDGVSTYRTAHTLLGSIATAGMILEVLLLGLSSATLEGWQRIRPCGSTLGTVATGTWAICGYHLAWWRARLGLTSPMF